MSSKFLITFFLILLFFTACGKKENNIAENQKYKAELSSFAKDYMLSLKKVLMKNMQEGGPIQAINVCSDTASEITQRYSEKNNILVKRFSFKNRNKNNVPDKIEKAVLDEFQKKFDAGKLDKQTYKLDKSEVDGKTKISFIKPIIIEAPCLNCHGNQTEIDSKVADFLREKYPNDKATEYKIGDLRGAISVTKVL